MTDQEFLLHACDIFHTIISSYLARLPLAYANSNIYMHDEKLIINPEIKQELVEELKNAINLIRTATLLQKMLIYQAVGEIVDIVLLQFVKIGLTLTKEQLRLTIPIWDPNVSRQEIQDVAPRPPGPGPSPKASPPAAPASAMLNIDSMQVEGDPSRGNKRHRPGCD